MSLLPDPTLTLSIWIGVFGKTLVKKGLLTHDEIIAELEDVKERLDSSNPHTAGLLMELDAMISTVTKW